MNEIEYVKGDATRPTTPGPKIIAHICNDVGGWGRGFVVAISKRWKEPEAKYREWYADRKSNDFGLGAAQFVKVGDRFMVANMIAQHNIGRGSGGVPPIRYDALRSCLDRVALAAEVCGASVHMPRIGCGLAGGSWSQIEPIIVETLCKAGIPVYVYDL